MSKVLCMCYECGKEFYRWPHEARGRYRVWCSQSCHMKSLNAEMNPKRPPSEKKQRKIVKSVDSNSYRRSHGRHEHRVVAEEILGRPLRAGEVVHHINGDKRDNRPENLMIFSSQAEHAAEHFYGPNNPRSRAVLCIDSNVTYTTIHEAALKTGANEKAISAVCRGKRKHAGGYAWRYAEEVISNGSF